jgi:hypothetical protein
VPRRFLLCLYAPCAPLKLPRSFLPMETVWANHVARRSDLSERSPSSWSGRTTSWASALWAQVYTAPSQCHACTTHRTTAKVDTIFSFLQAGCSPHSTPSHTLSLWSNTCSPNTIPDHEFLVEQQELLVKQVFQQSTLYKQFWLVNKKFLSRLHSPFLSAICSQKHRTNFST